FPSKDAATTQISTLSLHDALPIFEQVSVPLPAKSTGTMKGKPTPVSVWPGGIGGIATGAKVTIVMLPVGLESSQTLVFEGCEGADRKSTRLNSSHSQISYAVFCLK